MFNVGEELKRARRIGQMSPTQLARTAECSPSTVTRIESGETQPTFELAVRLFEACGFELSAEPTNPDQAREEQPMPTEPTTYPNPRGNNPWDNDTIHWLLEQPDVAREFTHGVLFECLRRQPNRVRNQPNRVAEAEALARRFGVEQHVIHDPVLGKDIVRLVRTDADAPTYPW